MCDNSLDIERSNLKGNYSLKRVCNFLVCERQNSQEDGSVIESDVCLGSFERLVKNYICLVCIFSCLTSQLILVDTFIW